MYTVKQLVKKENAIDILLMLDCTGSMIKWIDEAAKNLVNIIDKLKEKVSDMCNVRCAFIGYKDIGDKGQTKDHFDIIDFTEDVEEVKKMIL
jgi:uncharacterized protein YegL